MLLWPRIALLGCAGALMATIATPALGATEPTTTPVPLPRTGVITVPCPPATVIHRDGKTIKVVPPPAGQRPATPGCVQLLNRSDRGRIPRGAPETGGGGMAAEVSSWS